MFIQKCLLFLAIIFPFIFIITFTLEIYLLCFEPFYKVCKFRPNLALCSGQQLSCIYFPRTCSHSCNLMSYGIYPRKKNGRHSKTKKILDASGPVECLFFQICFSTEECNIIQLWTRAARRNKQLNFCRWNAFELANIDSKNLLSNFFPKCEDWEYS